MHLKLISHFKIDRILICFFLCFPAVFLESKDHKALTLLRAVGPDWMARQNGGVWAICTPVKTQMRRRRRLLLRVCQLNSWKIEIENLLGIIQSPECQVQTKLD